VVTRPISEAWGLREMTEADTLLSLDPSSQQEGSGSAVPQNIVFLNASAVFLGILADAIAVHLDYCYSWNSADHGSGLNVCLGREGRGIREPKVLDQASHAHCKPELGKHESELPIAMFTSL